MKIHGVINWDKSVALEAKYDEVKQIYGNGRFVVKQDGKWKIVDTTGNSYLEEKFDDVKSINGENVVIQKNGKYGIMTISGDTKLETKYEDIKFTYADNYIAKLEGKYGIVNVAGQTKLILYIITWYIEVMWISTRVQKKILIQI